MDGVLTRVVDAMSVISDFSCWNSASRKPRSVSVGTPDSDWAARAFIRWRTSPIRARPPSATCTTEAPWEALMPAWVSAVTSAFRRVPMARPAASSEAFTMREPEASLPTELEAMDELEFRKRRAEFAAVLLATKGIVRSLLQQEH